jgi:hypothetical protein
LLKNGYITTTKVFICPSSKERNASDSSTFPTDYKAAALDKLILSDNQCSYGWDVTKKHTVDATCAIIADKPRPTPGTEGSALNNSANHSDEGQNVFYNDGHVKWGTTPKPDSGSDVDIYTWKPDITKNTDPNYGWDAKIIK